MGVGHQTPEPIFRLKVVGIDSSRLEATVSGLEADIKAEFSEVRKIFIEAQAFCGARDRAGQAIIGDPES